MPGRGGRGTTRGVGYMRTLLAALLAATAITPVLAADLRPPAPAPVAHVAPVISWTGFYVGVNLGWIRQQGSVDIFGANADTQRVVDFAKSIGIPTSFNTDDDSLIGGAHAGFNYQVHPYVVFGVETDIEATGIKGHDRWDVPPSIRGLNAASSITVDEKRTWLGTTRARLGFTPVPAVLLYGTGGVAY